MSNIKIRTKFDNVGANGNSPLPRNYIMNNPLKWEMDDLFQKDEREFNTISIPFTL